ncbi:hypothetical protein MTX20_35110 [Bradyrhizobium sp. ISRA435]|nr:hypothetical protein MTX20_35110 [Bradyrhizobium sp. ISRA435]
MFFPIFNSLAVWEARMRRIFQAFVDRLVESKSPEDLRQAMSQAASALNLCSFAYLAPPRATGAGAAPDLQLPANLDLPLPAPKL